MWPAAQAVKLAAPVERLELQPSALPPTVR
jgi:hypothetical protein